MAAALNNQHRTTGEGNGISMYNGITSWRKRNAERHQSAKRNNQCRSLQRQVSMAISVIKPANNGIAVSISHGGSNS